MNRIKFLHFGDLHLDMPFTSLGEVELRPAYRRQELKSCLERIITLARDENVQVILISGDLFEHSYVRKSTIHYVNDTFTKVPDIKIFIVPGNHDPLVVNSFYRNFEWSENVFILGEGAPLVRLEEQGTCIYGAGFRSFYERNSLLSEVPQVDPRLINIFLVHGTVDMNIGSENYNPMSVDELAGLGMDYIALGHFHNCIFDLGGKGMIFNPGSPEPLGFDEPGEHGVFIGTLCKESEGSRCSVDVRFVGINQRYYKTVEVNATGCGSNEQVLEKINSALYTEKLEENLFDIRIKGYVERGFKIDVTYLQNFFKDRTFFLKVKDETRPDFDIEEISKEPGLRGLYARKILALIEKEQDNKKRSLLRDSLYFGLQAMENGEIEIV